MEIVVVTPFSSMSEVARRVVEEGGKVVLEGNLKDLLNDVRVREAYLGKLKDSA